MKIEGGGQLDRDGIVTIYAESVNQLRGLGCLPKGFPSAGLATFEEVIMKGTTSVADYFSYISFCMKFKDNTDKIDELVKLINLGYSVDLALETLSLGERLPRVAVKVRENCARRVSRTYHN